MKQILLKSIILLLWPGLFQAKGSTTEPTQNDSILFVIPSPAMVPEAKVEKESKLGHFTWGADAGSAVDLTGNDMTSIDLHGYFGYKGGALRILGVGAGINTMINNSSRCYPVYALLRTSFSTRPQLCFLDLRAGVSFNNILTYKSQTDFYGSLGIGITLASGKKFSSHIILSYNFMPIRNFTVYSEVPADLPGENFEGDTPPTTIVEHSESFPDLHYAAIRIGCSF